MATGGGDPEAMPAVTTQAVTEARQPAIRLNISKFYYSVTLFIANNTLYVNVTDFTLLFTHSTEFSD